MPHPFDTVIEILQTLPKGVRLSSERGKNRYWLTWAVLGGKYSKDQMVRPSLAASWNRSEIFMMVSGREKDESERGTTIIRL